MSTIDWTTSRWTSERMAWRVTHRSISPISPKRSAVFFPAAGISLRVRIGPDRLSEALSFRA
jgi:hypothetical protein